MLYNYEGVKMKKTTDTINAEINKPLGKADIDYIQSEVEREIGYSTESMSEDAIRAKTAEIMAEYDKQQSGGKRVKTRHTTKIAKIVMAACLVLLVVTSADIVTEGFDTGGSITKGVFSWFLDSKEQGEFVSKVSGERVRYKSIKDLLKNEKLDVALPPYMPKGCKLIEASVIQDGPTKVLDVWYLLKDASVHFGVRIDSDLLKTTPDFREYVDIFHDAQTYYFSSQRSELIWYRDNNSYCITGIADMDEIKKIITNIDKGHK